MKNKVEISKMSEHKITQNINGIQQAGIMHLVHHYAGTDDYASFRKYAKMNPMALWYTRGKAEKGDTVLDVYSGPYFLNGTALYRASKKGNMQIVQYILQEQPSKSVDNAEQLQKILGNALQAACTENHTEVAMTLVDAGANIAHRFFFCVEEVIDQGNVHLMAFMLLYLQKSNIDILLMDVPDKNRELYTERVKELYSLLSTYF